MQSEAEVKERSANTQAKKPAAKLSYNTETPEKFGMGRSSGSVSTLRKKNVSVT